MANKFKKKHNTNYRDRNEKKSTPSVLSNIHIYVYINKYK